MAYPVIVPMVECNNDEERRLRIQRTLQRLVKATAELEALKHPKVIVELAPLTPRDPQMPPRKWDRL
jgi:hypothetical protein